MKIKVGVIFGGESVEHEVSVISAIQAINNINKDKYDVVPIYISKEREWYSGYELLNIENYKDLEYVKRNSKHVSLAKINNEFCLVNLNSLFNKTVAKIDVAFPIVHGQNVEDGSLAGYLETVGIPYVGSNVLGSCLGQDKVIMKDIFKNNNIPIVDYIWFYDSEYIDDSKCIFDKIKKLGYPVVVKPASLGSSVGITFVKDESEIQNAIEEAISYDKKIIIEKAVNNLVEVNCSVLGDYRKQECSAIEQVLSENSILTFEDKYVGSGKSKGKTKGMANTSRIIPAQIGEKLTKAVERISKEAFRVLELSGVCRIDFLIDSKKGDVYINEPNTIPGSLSFYLWENVNVKYSELLDRMISICVKNYKNRQKKVSHFDTNILSNCHNNFGAKKFGVK